MQRKRKRQMLRKLKKLRPRKRKRRKKKRFRLKKTRKPSLKVKPMQLQQLRVKQKKIKSKKLSPLKRKRMMRLLKNRHHKMKVKFNRKLMMVRAPKQLLNSCNLKRSGMLLLIKSEMKVYIAKIRSKQTVEKQILKSKHQVQQVLQLRRGHQLYRMMMNIVPV